MRRIIYAIKKPFVFLKNKTVLQREFLRDGRPGGMIAEAILAAQFFTWLMNDLFMGRLPVVVAFIIAAVAAVLASELLAFVLRLIFGGSKRCRAYFIVAFSVVIANNMIGNQGGAAPGAFLMSFAMALFANILGRCIWSFIDNRRFKQVFGYVMSAIALGYLIFYGFFYHTDSFGKSRVDFYNNIKNSTPVVSLSEKAVGFDEYLKDGSYEVATLSYGPEEDADIVTESLDYSNFDLLENPDLVGKITIALSDYDFTKTPVKGQIWYPEGQSDCPTLFFVHGNHDSGTPSYLGYDYLGKYLASNGYAVVSVDENIINELGVGNDIRAILLLDNMKAILSENEKAGSPIKGLIDTDRVAIGGHSRGGEMAPTAYLFNGLDTYPEDGNVKIDYHFDIKSIVAIAPVVDQYRPASRSVEISDVNYLLIHGSNDQDVSSMMGEKQYNNLTFTEDSGEHFLKSEVYILGANHGQFNSLWGRYDMMGAANGYLNTYNFLDEADQKLIAKAYIRSFLDTTLCGDKRFASLLKEVNGYEDYLPDTAYVTGYEDSDFESICSFDGTTNIKDFESGASIDVTGSDTWTIKPYSRGNGGEGEDYVLSVNWSEGGSPSVKVTFPAMDITKGGLSFGIADMREDTADKEKAFDYVVTLTDATGHTATVQNPKLIYPSLAVQLYKQDVLFGSYEYKHQLQTVLLTPDSFVTSSTKLDYTAIKSLIITPKGSDAGEIIINQIGYYK
ncbi:MAG: hypothetical protein J5537_00620 [Lachnospiraceae bacterium]|nr:hypothetical protein [Lachnospiraceae bacterium]